MLPSSRFPYLSHTIKTPSASFASRSRFSRRLPRYAAAAVAASAGPALPAAIIHITAPFNVNTHGSAHAWDIDGGGTDDFQFFNNYSSASSRSLLAFRGNAGNAWVRGNASASFHLRAVPGNFTIGAAGPFQASAQVAFSSNGAPQGGLHSGAEYVGFKFQLTGQTHYGWANITLGGSGLTFNDWAYESTADTPIAAGAVVPEPAQSAAGLGLLALGAAGVAAFKRRAKAKAV